MVQLTQKEVRQRAPFWFGALLVLNFGLMVMTTRRPDTNDFVVRGWVQTIFSPFQSASSAVGDTGRGFFSNIANFRQSAHENQELKLRVEQLEADARAGQAARVENERLLGLLNLNERAEYQTLPARVISRGASAWFDTITINRGSTSGVEKDMPVVTPSGVVGRIIGVAPVTSQVMLLSNEVAGAGAVVGQLATSSALGSVRGLGANGLLEMRYVSGLETVNVGDTITTTGQDLIYPPGLEIGTILEVGVGTATSTHTITVKPSAQLDRLEYVAVLLYKPQKNQESSSIVTPSRNLAPNANAPKPNSNPSGASSPSATPKPSPKSSPSPKPSPSPKSSPTAKPSPTARPSTSPRLTPSASPAARNANNTPRN